MAEFIVGGLFATALWLYRTPPPPKPKDDVNLTPPVFDRLPPVSERMMQSAMQHAFSIERRRRLFNDHFINDNDVRGRSVLFIRASFVLLFPATHSVLFRTQHQCTVLWLYAVGSVPPSSAAGPLVFAVFPSTSS